jgi:hypothetical protein
MTTTPLANGSNHPLSLSPVLIIQQSEQVWVAKLLTWAGFSVEGTSREEALQKLDQQVKAELSDGEITYLDLPLTRMENPWLAVAGKYANDPTWDDYQAAIADARREANEAEGICLEGDEMV